MPNDQDPIEEVHASFRRHVPEVAKGIVELVKIARDPGSRTIVAVRSNQYAVHPISACSLPSKLIARDLGEKIDVVLHDEAPATLIMHALMPIAPCGTSRTPTVTLDVPSGVAWVEVPPDSVTFLSIPSQVARVALVSRLVGWEIWITAGMRGGRGA